MDPAEPTVYHNRGCVRNALGKHEEAVRNFDKAIDLDPELALSYLFRGVAKKIIGREEEAVKDSARAVGIDPSLDIGQRVLEHEAIIRGERELPSSHLVASDEP